MNDSAKNRRALLLEEMQRLKESQVDCSQCSGECCTFVRNSIKITPVEAWDMYQFLHAKGRWNFALQSHLEETVRRFRLDTDVSNGKRSFVRKTYTCPFFAGKSLGCTIAAENKPYGCLGFNPKQPNRVNGDHCNPNLELLKSHEATICYDNATIKFQENAFAWERSYIPLALLHLFTLYPPEDCHES